MCGIAGIFQVNGGDIDGEELAAMSEAIAHRGPDQDGISIEDGIGLAARRLAIIDPAGGNQPIHSADGEHCIVFNGEIYNHRELRKELVSRGQRFSTQSDTEVVLNAYREFGDECLGRLRGIFALAIWDRPRRRLFLARDRLGVKPLFHRFQSNRFSFASEIKAFLRQRDFSPTCNAAAFHEYLMCGFPVNARSMFRDVDVLEPGHYLVADASGVSTKAYWDFSFAARNDAEPEVCSRELYHRLDDAVTVELAADVPVASCLSGGLDSSLVAALAARHTPSLKTFTIGYAHNTEVFRQSPNRIVGEVTGDDMGYADLAAQRLGTDHHAAVLSLDDLCPDIDRMIWHREKPLLTLSEYGHRHLARRVSGSRKVLLSGQGSDELFGGYYYWWQFKDPERTRFFPWVWRTSPDQAAYPVTAVDMLEDMLNPGFREVAGGMEALQGRFDTLTAAADATDFLGKVTYLLLKTHLHEMLELEDRHGMAASVEIRVPFLDYRLAEWSAGLPRNVRAPGWTEKALLKRMAREHVSELPDEIVARKKSPMPPPIDTSRLVDHMVDTLRSPSLRIGEVVDRRRLHALLEAVNAQTMGIVSQHHYALFRLYYLERWFHVFGAGL
jgi:asparagine synthase (glutamine-hydrolysing)